MSNVKKIVMIVLLSCLLIAMTFEVKATNDGNPIDISGDIGDISINGEGTGTTTPDLNTINETNEQNSQVIQPDTNITENVSNTLPQTGITEDITVMFFIIVCTVSAIYAYKKIKDYNG